MAYAVIVTFGTRANCQYAANIKNRKDAEALQRCAMERGYSDARIELEEDFRAAQEANRGGQAGSRRSVA